VQAAQRFARYPLLSLSVIVVLVTIYAGAVLLSLDPCLNGLVAFPVSELVADWGIWRLCGGRLWDRFGVRLVMAWSNVCRLCGLSLSGLPGGGWLLYGAGVLWPLC
jgi:hypothetical protein